MEFVKMIKRYMIKEYVVYIYHDENEPRRCSFTDWGLAKRWARINTGAGDRYKIRCKRGGRYTWDTGLIAGGPYGRRPKRKFYLNF